MKTVPSPNGARKPREAPKPCLCTAAWIRRITDGQPGVLVIAVVRDASPTLTADYTVRPVLDGDRLVGFDLAREGAADTYFVHLAGPGGRWGCTCWDWLTRQKLAERPDSLDCKHVAGLKQALTAGRAAS
jgi:hypothetical protein